MNIQMGGKCINVFFMGMHLGVTKYRSFVSLWDSRVSTEHYEEQHWLTRSLYVPGVNSVQEFSISNQQILNSPDATFAYNLQTWV